MTRPTARRPGDRGADEVDLQLDCRVPDPVGLESRQRHAHCGVGDLGDHTALDHPSAVPMLRAGDQFDHDAAGLGLGDPGTEGLHPARRAGRQQCRRPTEILNMFVFS
jgi:hypothetical protein